jgi:hypothetical protein
MKYGGFISQGRRFLFVARVTADDRNRYTDAWRALSSRRNDERDVAAFQVVVGLRKSIVMQAPDRGKLKHKT